MSEEDERPFRQPVWGYVDDGVIRAQEEFDEFVAVMGEDSQRVLRMVVAILFRAHETLSTPESHERTWKTLISLQDDPLVAEVVEQGLDLQFAKDARDRLMAWRQRLRLLKPATVKRMANDRVRNYTAEATRAFLYGFDAACIAMCRATLEQIMKEVYVRAGLATWDDVQKSTVALRDRISMVFTVAPLRYKTPAVQAKVRTAAHRITDDGNLILHRYLFEQRISKRKAADALHDLAVVVSGIYG